MSEQEVMTSEKVRDGLARTRRRDRRETCLYQVVDQPLSIIHPPPLPQRVGVTRSLIHSFSLFLSLSPSNPRQAKPSTTITAPSAQARRWGGGG
jgi:hypothetical protein